MPRARSARSDVTDCDIDGVAERELEYQRLQRQYRIMQNDRRAYCQETQDVILRQRSEITKLNGEQEGILKDLRLIESRSNQTKDDCNVDKLGALGSMKADVDSQIGEEKIREQEIMAEIREWQKKVKVHAKTAGGVHMSSQHTVQMSKNTSKLENQLQMANNSFCKRLENNRLQRDSIDSLRVERRRFDSLHNRLERRREQLKQEIGSVIDQSTQAYDQRDEAQAKMILLKEKADKDLQMHTAEMKENVRCIDHARKLEDFMNVKGSERDEDKWLVFWRQRKEDMEQEKKKASQTDTVESYDMAVERIKDLTGENDLDLLVSRFIENEDTNFALFNFVNEQNNQKEDLEDNIQKINEEISKFKKQGIELEDQRKSILKRLDNRTNDALSKTGEQGIKLKTINKIIDQLKAGVESLFSKLSCSRGAIDEMLGAQKGITEANMIQYLGIIEQKTNLLLLLQAYVNTLKGDDYGRKQPVLLGEGPQPPAPQMPVQPPTVGDEYDSADSASDDERPMTRNELTTKVMKSVKKREIAMRKEGFKYDLSDAREKAKKKDSKKR